AHSSSGSGELPSRCVRWPTPMMHGARESTAAPLTTSLPLPVGLALLGERLRALLGVLALEHHAADLLLELVGVVERQREATQHALLGGLYRERRVDGDASGHGVRRVEQVLRRNDLVDQAHLPRPLRIDGVGREQEL